MFNSKDLPFNNLKSKDPILIIIRGPASSGKSSVAKDLMKTINEISNDHIYNNPFFLFPYEDLLLFHMMDSNFLVNGKESIRGFNIKRDEEENIIDFQGSSWALKLYETYQNTLYSYTNNNFNIICDGNFINLDNIKNLLKKLNNYRVIICSLNVPLEILEKRESNRIDRDRGFAKLQFNTYQETLKNISYQYIISIEENFSIKNITNRILEIFKTQNHLFSHEILKII